MSFDLYFTAGRSAKQVVTLYEADDNGLTLNAGDVVRMKVFRRNRQTPALDIDSVGALSGGSLITVTQTASAAVVEVFVGQDDTPTLSGTYSAELLLVDSGDSNKVKLIEAGTVHFLPSGAGDVGLT